MASASTTIIDEPSSLDRPILEPNGGLMRTLGKLWTITLLAAGMLTCLSGATCVENINRPPLPPNATLEQAVEVVNAQTRGIQRIESSTAKLSVTIPGIPLPSLTTRLAVERPKRLRLVSTLLGSEEIDIGSNDDHFWFWVRLNSPKAVYYSKHKDYWYSPLRRQVPLDPSWLMESMGLGVFGPNDRHVSIKPISGGRLEIRTVRQTPVDRQYKITRIDANMGWVLEQHLFDGEGKPIASTITGNHITDPYTGSVLPKRIHLRWPATKMGLKLSLGNVELNSDQEHGLEIWSMPHKPDYPLQNLANVQLVTE